MAGKNDYGYFGSGAEGYAHYKQTFDSTFPSSGSRGSSRSTVHSSPSTQVCTAAEQNCQNDSVAPQTSTDQSDAGCSLLYAFGMLGLALVVWAVIFMVLS